MTVRSWSAGTPCAGATDLFFDPERVAEAVALCATCPVRIECDAYATAERITNGVWGGIDRTAPLEPEPPAPKPHRVSYGGYVAHLKAGETPCAECRAAKKAYQRDYDRRKRAERRAT